MFFNVVIALHRFVLVAVRIFDRGKLIFILVLMLYYIHIFTGKGTLHRVCTVLCCKFTRHAELENALLVILLSPMGASYPISFNYQRKVKVDGNEERKKVIDIIRSKYIICSVSLLK